MIVTRSGQQAGVMLSLEDFKSLEETSYLFRSPENAKRLLSSVTALAKGKGQRQGTAVDQVKLIFSDEAWEDDLYWRRQDKAVVKRINELITACRRDPFVGIGKPEPLKHALAGFWSRRINAEHRMVYKADKDALSIAQLRYHY